MKNSTLFALIILSIASLTFHIGCTDSQAAPDNETYEQPRDVETAKVRKELFVKTVVGSGRLSSKEEIKLSFKTGGIIKRIAVVEGQSIRQGETLAELDLQEINAQVEQAELGVQQSEITIANAKLGLERAERDFRNVKGLYEDSVATLEQFEDVELQLRNARNQLEAAQQGNAYSSKNKEIADFNLRYSKIIAPSDGTILRKLSAPNELVGPGMPVFLFGAQNKAQVIKVNVTDKDIIHLKLGDAAEIQFDAYPEQVFKGTVQEIASMADPYTNTYEVELEIDPAGKILLSGFIGSVRIRTSGSESLIRIPVDALVKADGHSGEVFVVRAGRAELVNIEIHSLGSDRLLLRGALQPGDEVIVKGGGYLEAKDSVLVGKPK
ncbi:MAG: efflux RND transporter periplasmic adaptor subunit [Phaeodactylibacter sp.]|nr:efflux RND transporter periplasmic adaptor subunit [Phaeodactylibacter sp.]